MHSVISDTVFLNVKLRMRLVSVPIPIGKPLALPAVPQLGNKSYLKLLLPARPSRRLHQLPLIASFCLSFAGGPQPAHRNTRFSGAIQRVASTAPQSTLLA